MEAAASAASLVACDSFSERRVDSVRVADTNPCCLSTFVQSGVRKTEDWSSGACESCGVEKLCCGVREELFTDTGVESTALPSREAAGEGAAGGGTPSSTLGAAATGTGAGCAGSA